MGLVRQFLSTCRLVGAVVILCQACIAFSSDQSVLEAFEQQNNIEAWLKPDVCGRLINGPIKTTTAVAAVIEMGKDARWADLSGYGVLGALAKGGRCANLDTVQSFIWINDWPKDRPDGTYILAIKFKDEVPKLLESGHLKTYIFDAKLVAVFEDRLLRPQDSIEDNRLKHFATNRVIK